MTAVSVTTGKPTDRGDALTAVQTTNTIAQSEITGFVTIGLNASTVTLDEPCPMGEHRGPKVELTPERTRIYISAVRNTARETLHAAQELRNLVVSKYFYTQVLRQ